MTPARAGWKTAPTAPHPPRLLGSKGVPMSRLLNRFRKPSATRSTRQRTPLTVEALEERSLLSVTAHFNWAMAPRFGLDQGSLGPDGNTPLDPNHPLAPDGRIDLWNDPNYVQNLDPTT